MKEALRNAINEAFLHARVAARMQDPQDAFRWLERAHILTQRMPLLHARAHWLMLQLAWSTRDFREVSGQIPRIIAALLFSTLWVPIGNTGRARVSAFAPMAMPEDIQQLLSKEEL